MNDLDTDTGAKEENKQRLRHCCLSSQVGSQRQGQRQDFGRWSQDEPVRKGGRKGVLINRVPGRHHWGPWEFRLQGGPPGRGAGDSPPTPSGRWTWELCLVPWVLITLHVQLPWDLHTEQVLRQTVPQVGTSFL